MLCIIFGLSEQWTYTKHEWLTVGEIGSNMLLRKGSQSLHLLSITSQSWTSNLPLFLSLYVTTRLWISIRSSEQQSFCHSPFVFWVNLSDRPPLRTPEVIRRCWLVPLSAVWSAFSILVSSDLSSKLSSSSVVCARSHQHPFPLQSPPPITPLSRSPSPRLFSLDLYNSFLWTPGVQKVLQIQVVF